MTSMTELAAAPLRPARTRPTGGFAFIVFAVRRRSCPPPPNPPGGGWKACCQRAAPATRLAAFAVLVLQTTGPAGMGAHMFHDQLSMAAVDPYCQPSDVSEDESGLSLSNPCSADADKLNTQGDSCEQLCMISVVLRGHSPVDLSVGGDFLFKIWSDRLGRTGLGLLRPPRSFAAA